MVTIYFETEVVAASVRFDADDYDISIPEGRLHILKKHKEIATFEAGIWKYVDITEFEVPVDKEEKRIISRNQAMQSSESIV